MSFLGVFGAKISRSSFSCISFSVIVHAIPFQILKAVRNLPFAIHQMNSRKSLKPIWVHRSLMSKYGKNLWERTVLTDWESEKERRKQRNRLLCKKKIYRKISIYFLYTSNRAEWISFFFCETFFVETFKNSPFWIHFFFSIKCNEFKIN